MAPSCRLLTGSGRASPCWVWQLSLQAGGHSCFTQNNSSSIPFCRRRYYFPPKSSSNSSIFLSAQTKIMPLWYTRCFHARSAVVVLRRSLPNFLSESDHLFRPGRPVDGPAEDVEHAREDTPADGARRGLPVSSTAMPRARPWGGVRAMPRTRFLSRCARTSMTTIPFLPDSLYVPIKGNT